MYGNPSGGGLFEFLLERGAAGVEQLAGRFEPPFGQNCLDPDQCTSYARALHRIEKLGIVGPPPW